MQERVRFQAMPRQQSLDELLALACAAADLGRDLVRMRVRLEDPDASDEDIAAAIRAWLEGDRDDAPTDNERPVAWPRR